MGYAIAVPLRSEQLDSPSDKRRAQMRFLRSTRMTTQRTARSAKCPLHIAAKINETWLNSDFLHMLTHI